MKFNRQTIARGVAAATSGLVALGMTVPAQAAFTVPTEVIDAATSVALIGTAVFAIAVGIKLYKWLKGAL